MVWGEILLQVLDICIYISAAAAAAAATEAQIYLTLHLAHEILGELHLILSIQTIAM